MKRNVLIIAASVLLGAGLFWDGQGAQSEAAQLQSRILEVEKAAKEAAANLGTDQQLGTSRSTTANRLSAELDVLCTNTGVRLKQVQFEPATNPVSPTGESGATKGWGLNHATIMLEGTAPQIYQALRQMGATATVFRLDELAIHRVVSQEGGSTGVLAELKVAVLVRSEVKS